MFRPTVRRSTRAAAVSPPDPRPCKGTGPGTVPVPVIGEHDGAMTRILVVANQTLGAPSSRRPSRPTPRVDAEMVVVAPISVSEGESPVGLSTHRPLHPQRRADRPCAGRRPPRARARQVEAARGDGAWRDRRPRPSSAGYRSSSASPSSTPSSSARCRRGCLAGSGWTCPVDWRERRSRPRSSMCQVRRDPRCRRSDHHDVSEPSPFPPPPPLPAPQGRLQLPDLCVQPIIVRARGALAATRQ